MIWSHFIGQELLKKQMEYLISSNQVPHAQLFTGISGYGALPLAIEFSLLLLKANNPNENHTLLGKKSQHPDLHFVFPIVKKGSEKVVYSHDYSPEWCLFLDEKPYGDYTAWFESIEVGNKQGIIGVAEIENLHQKIYLKAFNGKGKVCILWGVEKMNVQAANAFLKLLEEPPKDTYFLLIAEDSENVLPTILSRCQQVELGPIPAESLKAAIPPDVKNADQMIIQADGDYNRLLVLLHDVKNQTYESTLVLGLRHAFKAKGNKAIVHELIQWSSQLAALGREEQKAFLNYGVQLFRDAFLLNYSMDKLVHFRSETNFDLSKLAPYVHNENIKDLVALFEKTHYHILRNGNAKMLFADLALKLTRLINLPQQKSS